MTRVHLLRIIPFKKRYWIFSACLHDPLCYLKLFTDSYLLLFFYYVSLLAKSILSLASMQEHKVMNMHGLFFLYMWIIYLHYWKSTVSHEKRSLVKQELTVLKREKNVAYIFLHNILHSRAWIFFLHGTFQNCLT